MKLVLVLCACVAGSLAYVPTFRAATAGALGGAAGGLQKFGTDALKSSDLLRDARRTNAAAQLFANNGQQSGRRGTAYGDEARRDSALERASLQGYGQNAANADRKEGAASRSAARDQAYALNQNEFAAKNAADRAAANNYFAAGDQFRQGRRNHDGIDYGFDKKFNTRNHEDGGYVYSESSDSHALDDYADKSGIYSKRRGEHAAAAAKSDAQSADRKSAFAQKADASAAAADNFGRDYDSSSKAYGRNKDLSQKLDASQAGNRYRADAKERALDAYTDLAARDSNVARQSNAFGDADGKLGQADYGYGVAGAKGYAPKPGAYPYGAGGKGLAAADYAKRAGAADLARLWDQSHENRLKKAEKDSLRDEAKSSFSKDQWLSDREQGYDRDQAARANDHGYANTANKADRSAAGYDAKSADAASRAGAQQARYDLDENVYRKDNRRRNLSDRKANNNVSKKFYRNNVNGGDNYERLNYDRDQVDDVFGYKAGTKKDAANRASDSRYNRAYDAAARKADAERASDASRAFNKYDARKAADGYVNAEAKAADSANSDRKGLRNDNYKNDVAQNAYDQKYRTADAYDRGSDRFGADQRAFGKNLGYGNRFAAGSAFPVRRGGPGFVRGVGFARGPGFGGAYGGGYGGGYGNAYGNLGNRYGYGGAPYYGGKAGYVH